MRKKEGEKTKGGKAGAIFDGGDRASISLSQGFGGCRGGERDACSLVERKKRVFSQRIGRT